jgi:hypothetical protein
MQKRVLGYLLTIIGFGGMVLAGYLFVTGSGGRINLLEVTCYMVAGATSFFTGISYIYEARTTFSPEEFQTIPEFEEVSAIQQQWRTIHVAKRPVREVREMNTTQQAAAV